ncbi:MAG: hypothetical protein H6573_26795 [Lewinellaceae bacterium]|nr:hypothetical protein [Phaeodactylibacter sp.]MCB0612076.1 hypothetical protein [Phaeodactylibacter sp.]MCB9351082.1 hypothetical protein [Lewinellaceae bacterium]
MDTKLTLKLDKEVIERARRFARQYNTSLSKLVEHYFEQITQQNNNEETTELTPLVRSLYGIAAIQPGFDPETAYFDHLFEKHSPQDAS